MTTPSLPRLQLVTPVAALFAFLAQSALANDTTAALAAGGLIFEHTDQIRMELERLKISTKLVEVDYVFKNIGNTDISTTIAFPMPDTNDGDSYHHDIAIPAPGPNFLDFRTWVDGAEVRPLLEVRYQLDGKDIIAARDSYDPDMADNAPTELREKWLERGWAHREEPDIVPDWTTKMSFHWPQIFRARQETLHPSPLPTFGRRGSCRLSRHRCAG